MPSNSIIYRIKNIFKKEKQKKKDHRKRKLCFEQLESKELLSTTVSFGGTYDLTEGAARFEGSNILPGGGGGCCCGGSGCCCSGCCCTSGCFPSPGYMIGGCVATPNQSFSGSFQHIPITVVADPNNPYWLPQCFGINFYVTPEVNQQVSGNIQIYVRYKESGIQKHEPVTYYNPSNSNCFLINYRPGMSDIKLEVTAINDFTPEPDQTFCIDLLPNKYSTWIGATGGGCQLVEDWLYVSGSSSQATVIVHDDDHWKVGVETFNDIATERLPDVEQDYAYYKFTKSGGTDWQYGIDVQFTTEEIVKPGDSSYITETATYSTDYNFAVNKFDKLTDSAKYNQELAILGVTADEYERGVFLTNFSYLSNKTTTTPLGDGRELITRYFTAKIPPGSLDDEYYHHLRDVFFLRVEPKFDWVDEGALFDPVNPGQGPGQQLGEIINLKIMDNPSPVTGLSQNVCGVWWSGLYSSYCGNWDPVNHNKQIAIPVEIKDGAILELYLDYDGDGLFDINDRKSSVLDKPFFLDWNTDDDNKNGILDYKEGVGNYSYQGYAGVTGENDLRKVKLYAWVGDLVSVKNGVGDYTFEVFQNDPTGNSVSVQLWQDPIKSNTLAPTDVLPLRTKIGTISKSVKTVTRDFWMERIAMNEVSLSAKADCYQGGTRKSAHDGSESTLITVFDVAVDSDNNGTIDHSDIENFLEDHEYGLGKIINWAKSIDLYSPGSGDLKITSPAMINKLVPVVITCPSYIYNSRLEYYLSFSLSNPTSKLIFFSKENNNSYLKKYDAVTGPNGIIPLSNDLWNNDNRTITLYVIEVVHNPNYTGGNTTYKDVNEKGRPTESFEVSLNSFSSIGKIASDKVQVISQSNDIAFFRELQNNSDLRFSIAANKIYGSNDAKEFCLKLLDEDELRGLGIQDPEIIGLLCGGTQSNPQNNNVGFNAGIYRDFINQKYILAYEGTNPGNEGINLDLLVDWITNIANGAGLAVGPYQNAVNVACYIQGKHNSQGDPQYKMIDYDRPPNEQLKKNITLVGHSMGGGLASMASVASTLPATTFNPAGINPYSFGSVVDAIAPSLGSGSTYTTYLRGRAIAYAQDELAETSQIRRITTKWDFLTNIQTFININSTGTFGLAPNTVQVSPSSAVCNSIVKF